MGRLPGCWLSCCGLPGCWLPCCRLSCCPAARGSAKRTCLAVAASAHKFLRQNCTALYPLYTRGKYCQCSAMLYKEASVHCKKKHTCSRQKVDSGVESQLGRKGSRLEGQRCRLPCTGCQGSCGLHWTYGGILAGNCDGLHWTCHRSSGGGILSGSCDGLSGGNPSIGRHLQSLQQSGLFQLLQCTQSGIGNARVVTSLVFHATDTSCCGRSSRYQT